MTSRSADVFFTRPLQLVLISDDGVFRGGLRLWLEQFAEFRVAIESGSGEDALPLIRTRLETGTSRGETVDLVLLDLDLGRTNPVRVQGLALCQQLRTLFPQVPVLVLGSTAEPILVDAVRRAGAQGFCLKGAEPGAIAKSLRQVAAGEPYWMASSGFREGTAQPRGASPSRRVSQASYLKRTLRQSGLEQMDQAIALITAQLRSRRLSFLQRQVLLGRRRELRAARWLVLRMLATPELLESIPEPSLPTVPAPSEPAPSLSVAVPPAAIREAIPTGIARPESASPASRPQSASGASARQSEPRSGAGVLATAPQPALATAAAQSSREMRAVLFNRVLATLEGNLDNLTDLPLETDILRSDRKRELFGLVLRKLDDLLDDLRVAAVPEQRLVEMQPQLLVDLWQATTVEFFGRYTTLALSGQEVEIAPYLLADQAIVQTEILSKIPLFSDLLAHLLVQAPLVIDGVPYTAGNPEALRRAGLLLSHTMIQVANAVVQPLLNRFADVEDIKQSFYDRRLLSSRGIERFRNDLSWRYRMQRYFAEPKDIFESQYRLFVLRLRGIEQESIYAPRRDELEQLSGLPYAVTLALETRDAIAPRLRSVISVLGSGVIYILTEVIGRGIGLIGRGILKGVNNVVQDGRYDRQERRYGRSRGR
jgi:DNA-binding NarL/FixJ family response regulator